MNEFFGGPTRRHFMGLASTLLASSEALAGASSCVQGQGVDNGFRDAALAAFKTLWIRAPGKASDGAVMASPVPGHIDPTGQAWHYVSAYQVNLAFVGALRVAPQLVSEAARWLQWQKRHTTFTAPGEGMVFDHWVRASDLFEAPCPPGRPLSQCPQVDAYDSTAATLLLLADAYVMAGGEADLLRETGMRRALEGAVGTLMALTQPDGLSWAKPDHKVAYLMDNLEVAAAWRAWAHLQLSVFGAFRAARASEHMAERVDAAVLALLWHTPSGVWRVSQGAGLPSFARWYPDTIAQAWPLLWNTSLSAEAQQRAAEAWRRAAAHWREGPKDWSRRNVDPDDFWWPAAAAAAICAGDAPSAKVWVARARAHWLGSGASGGGFKQAFQVGDLFWLFWLSEP